MDVQRVINAALALDMEEGFELDADGDEDVEATDVQIVINAVLGFLTAFQQVMSNGRPRGRVACDKAVGNG